MKSSITSKDFYKSDTYISSWDAHNLFLDGFERGMIVQAKTDCTGDVLKPHITFSKFISEIDVSTLEYPWWNHQHLDKNSVGMIVSIDTVITRKTYGKPQKQKLTTREFPADELRVYSFIHLFYNNIDFLVKTDRFVSEQFDNLSK